MKKNIKKYLAIFVVTIFSTTAAPMQDQESLKKEVEHEEIRQEIKEYCENARKGLYKTLANALRVLADFFEENKKKDKEMYVIFDVDDTALDHLRWVSEGEQDVSNDTFGVKMQPIQVVLDFYNRLIEIGYSIIFLTARQETPKKGCQSSTHTNLVNAGYTEFKKLIMRPLHVDDKDVPVWKLEERKKIVFEGDCIIAASIDDQKVNLKGEEEYIGYPIFVPWNPETRE